MPSELQLTPPSFIVLGLLEVAGESTPYEMKKAVEATVGSFWSLQHAQLYREPERLARAGYLTVRSETDGRRRKFYEITELGKEALREWLAEPAGGIVLLRDQGLLKLFFGAKPGPVAQVRLPVHAAKLRELEETRRNAPPNAPQGWLYAIEAGIEHEGAWVRFYSRVLKNEGLPVTTA